MAASLPAARARQTIRQRLEILLWDFAQMSSDDPRRNIENRGFNEQSAIYGNIRNGEKIPPVRLGFSGWLLGGETMIIPTKVNTFGMIERLYLRFHAEMAPLTAKT